MLRCGHKLQRKADYDRFTPIISFVVAVAENGVIGRGGDLPWRIRSDLRTFRRVTMGKPVVMGRKTFSSLKKPLDGRDNIVVTRDPDFTAPEGVRVVLNIPDAMALAAACAADRGVDEIAVIGGADIFRAVLPDAGRMYYTRVLGAPAGDTFFPPFDKSDWQLVSSDPLPRSEGDDFTSVLDILERAPARLPATP